MLRAPQGARGFALILSAKGRDGRYHGRVHPALKGRHEIGGPKGAAGISAGHRALPVGVGPFGLEVQAQNLWLVLAVRHAWIIRLLQVTNQHRFGEID